MQEVARRIRERKLVQWAAAYLAAAWLILQVVALVGHSFDWSPFVVRGVVALLAAGFFAALVLAWYHGEQGRQRATGAELLMLAGILVIAAALVALVSGPGDGERSGRAAGAGVGGDDSRAAPAYGASVAVLPFDDLSGVPGGDYFAEGVTEEIIGELARIQGLKVISRTSVVALTGSRLTLPQIADTLGVLHVLQGSYRRSGDRVRVSVQLIDPASETHLWVETFDRELDDLFAVQEEIARQVGEALLARIEVVGPRGAGSRTERSAAYDAYLRGTFARQGQSREGLQEAIEAFEEAIALDPGFAPAYANLSASHTLWALFAYPGGIDLYHRAALALELAQRAVELDPSLAEAHAALGHARMRAGMPIDPAVADLERAVELAPSRAEGRLLLAVVLAAAGRHADAVRSAEIAVALDPLSAGGHDFLSVALTLNGRYEEAIAGARTALSLEPRFPNPRRQQARALLLLGRLDECVSGDVGPFLGLRASCLHSAGATAEARVLADSLAGLFASPDPAFPLQRASIAMDLAEHHAWLGDPAQALAWFRRSAESTPPNFILVQTPTFARAHRDPRFMAALNEIREEVRARVERSGVAVRAGLPTQP
jgi:TolB-like protein